MMRRLYKSDLPQLLAIEKSVHISPWNEETFKICLEQGYLGWVIEIKRKIVGFVMVALSLEDCHILNICIAREFQHQGCGFQLLRYSLEIAKKRGILIAYLEVRRSNRTAIHLYKKMGFHLIGERKAYYPCPHDAREDALIFGRSL